VASLSRARDILLLAMHLLLAILSSSTGSTANKVRHLCSNHKAHHRLLSSLSRAQDILLLAMHLLLAILSSRCSTANKAQHLRSICKHF